MKGRQAERAQVAVRELQRMLPGLTSFARSMTGISSMRVRVGATTQTDGRSFIELRPMGVLADIAEHDRAACDQRDQRGVPLCPACYRQDLIFSSVYHEISHVTSGSAAERATASMLAAAQDGLQRADCTDQLLLDAVAGEDYGAMPMSVLRWAHDVHPHVPALIRITEEVRVDALAAAARPGVDAMRHAVTERILDGDGNEDIGTPWSERAFEEQLLIGLLFSRQGHQVSGRLRADVVELIESAPVQEALSRECLSYQDGITMAFDLLARLNMMGLLRSPEQVKRDSDDAGAVGSGGDGGGGDDGQGDGEKSGDKGARQGDAGDTGEPGDREAGGGDSAPADENPAHDCDGDEDKPDSALDGAGAGEGGDESDGAGVEPHEEPEDADADGGPGADQSDGEDAPAEAGAGAPDAGNGGQRDGDAGEPGGGAGVGVDAQDLGEGGSQGSPGGGDGGSAGQMGGDGDGATGDELGGVGRSRGRSEGGAEGDPGPAQEERGGPGPDAGDGAADRPASAAELNYREMPDEDRVAPDRALQVLESALGHDGLGDAGDAGLRQAHVEIAVGQAVHFDSPSENVGTVVVHRGRGGPGWGGKKSMFGSTWKHTPIPERVLAPSVMHARRVFSDSRLDRNVRNLRRGKINPAALGKRAWGDDDRLFRKKLRAEGISFEVVIGMDISGSTSDGCIVLIKEAAEALANVLHRVGVDFSVYAHTTERALGMMSQSLHEVKPPRGMWGPGQRESLAALRPANGSLDGHNLEFYRKVLDRSTANRRMIVYFTDGEIPETNAREEKEVLLREVKMIQNRGYSIMAVGFGNDSPKKFGLDTIRIDRAEDMSTVVRELEKRITS